MKTRDLYLPRWFVQTADGTLHGYFNRDILLCDLTMNRGERVTILERAPGVLVRFVPVTEEQLRKGDAA